MGRVRADGGEAVRFSVRDRGIGIPLHEKTNIFRPFYRTRAARAAQIKGSGLGLSLAAEIVSAHGGRLTVLSESSEGSCFNLELPVWDAET